MLIDTSGLLCLHYPTEPLHSLACIAYQKATVKVTHSYIIAEYVALANARRFPRSSILAFVIDLLDNPDIETVWINESLYRKAIDLLMIRQDKSYSLCDSISFVLMRERRIKEALTTDRHFEQEGFIRLLHPEL
ncbi:type II toxin-antitoxin system VapC family toxin [Cuspidothrix issatschenkoi]|uniref:VapC toxin family PIN domain ribonuclease n=1 Tax=Cuspidothrix issatschenkoi CHARLIE-1 TaxID=2052836 RepID=A0A2S6CRX9_9CYAN|nr:PIN domain-containing protein [Cuspidothrix issatschenkoi]PPJ62459.1 VapC toxin family PIN domain ribonuclease [Cuspidothrix issatschenkoi CHARLIE-1]